MTEAGDTVIDGSRGAWNRTPRDGALNNGERGLHGDSLRRQGCVGDAIDHATLHVDDVHLAGWVLRK